MTTPHPDPVDDDLETWDQFILAVRHLARTIRPELTLAEAHREALQNWTGEAAALHGDHPFQPGPATR
jgi:hypothetical protein